MKAPGDTQGEPSDRSRENQFFLLRTVAVSHPHGIPRRGMMGMVDAVERVRLERDELEAAFQDLVRMGLIEEGEGRVRLTSAGEAAVPRSISGEPSHKPIDWVGVI